jgi:hypothetical protein
MALHNDVPVTWGSAATITVNSATVQVSDEITLNDYAIGLNITMNANNQGSPASGDTAIFRIHWSTDGTNFDTNEHAQFLATLDTYATNSPGEDPAQRTIGVDRRGGKCKISVECPNAGSRSILVDVSIEDERVQ